MTFWPRCLTLESGCRMRPLLRLLQFNSFVVKVANLALMTLWEAFLPTVVGLLHHINMFRVLRCVAAQCG